MAPRKYYFKTVQKNVTLQDVMPKRAYSYVRFSSDHQASGDSLRRQLEATRKYCAENNLALDESLNLHDLGVSAFRGRNSTKGSLGRFLDLAERGQIPAGSALVVESLDRISRESPRKAVALMNDILDHGIELHLTMIRKVFRPAQGADSGSQEGLDLLLAVVLAMRAHEESETKSRRLREVFANKRKRAAAGDGLVSKTVPWWLEIKKGEIIPIPERARIVRRIFSLKACGWSTQRIARQLNAEKMPTWRPRAKEWEDSRVRDTIRYDAALGHLMPTSKTKAAGGDSAEYRIENYYPRIVSDELAAKARAMKQVVKPRQSASGRPLNLLKGLLRHGGRWCRHQSHRNGKPGANGVKSYHSYYDDHDPNNFGKKTWSIAGNQLEPVLVAGIKELSSADFVPNGPGESRRSAQLKKKVRLLEEKIARLVEAVEKHGANALTSRLGELEREVTETRREVIRAEAQEGLAAPVNTLLRSMSSDLSDPQCRARTAVAISRLVTRMDVASDIAGLGLSKEFAIGLHAALVDALRLARQDDKTVMMPDPVPKTKRRKPLAILIHFRGGAYRLIARLPVGIVNVRVDKIRVPLLDSDDPFPSIANPRF
jgi:DNA invertase Pin-like site-specific DNA recombinase